VAKRSSKRPRVVITVDGGVVVRVATDTRDIDVYVLDYDDINDRYGDPNLSDVPKSRIRNDAVRGTGFVDKQLARWQQDAKKELDARAQEKTVRR
jgi:hypothetical protein